MNWEDLAEWTAIRMNRGATLLLSHRYADFPYASRFETDCGGKSCCVGR